VKAVRDKGLIVV